MASFTSFTLNPTRRGLFAALALATLAGTALAQTNTQPPANQPPLGGGRILDRGLSPTWGRVNNQVTDVQAMIRYNNAIASGDATGGRSLRVSSALSGGAFGSAGRATSSLYTFNRDAADWRVSVLGAQQAAAGQRAGDTGAYRSYLGAGVNTAASARIDRSFTGQSATQNARAIANRADGRSGLIVGYDIDSSGKASTVRASTLRGLISESINSRVDAPVLDLSANPQPLDTRVGEDGRAGRPAPRDTFNPKPPTSDGKDGKEGDTTKPAARPGETRDAGSIENLRRDRQNQGVAGQARLNDIRKAFRDSARTPASNEPADPTKVAPLTDSEIDVALDRLRARLRGDYVGVGQMPPKTYGPSAKPSATPATDTRAVSRADGAEARRPVLDELGEDRAVFSLERMEVRLKELIPEGASMDQAADGYMILAQEAMRENRYVSAEQAFDQVVTRRPSDVFARAGRIHAQLALTMFLSSGLEMRYLFADHPEMIPVRYEPAMIMSRQQAERVITLLREERGVNPASPVSREGALQIAYLGYQFDDKAWLDEGLGEMQKLYTEPPASDLYRVLDRAWRRGK